MSDYAPRLLEIDQQMRELGRPPPPAADWLRSGAVGNLPQRTAAWKAALAEWERLNADAAVEWLRLREAYKTEEEILDSRRFSDDEWKYENMRRLGFPERAMDAIRRPLAARQSHKAATEWAGGGLWSCVLSGGPGCGKTTSATWAAHQLYMRLNQRPKFLRCAAMVDAPAFGAEAELLKFRCKEAGVLVLDDIGSGAREKDAKLWLGWLDDVLDARWAAKRRTIITTNMASGVLATWLGLRLADRLNEGMIHASTDKSMRGATP